LRGWRLGGSDWCSVHLPFGPRVIRARNGGGRDSSGEPIACTAYEESKRRDWLIRLNEYYGSEITFQDNEYISLYLTDRELLAN
jgi:hypothetical protein